MAAFHLTPAQRFAGVNTTIKKPVEVAYFSYDSDHILHPFSELSLRYYYPPIFDTPQDTRQPIDLSKGFDTFRGRDDSPDEHLDGLLDTLMEAEKHDGRKTDVDIITWRGMMTKILTAAFESEDGFEMNATCFQGTIFIEESHDYKVALKAKQASQRRGRGPPGDLATYWGYKFETLSLLPVPWSEASREQIEGREDEITDNYAQYCSLVRTGIGPTSMILAGEVDGVLGYKPANPNEPARWIELKTARPPETDRDRQIHDKKMLKFWAQSFLLGVPKIFVGFRSRDGHLLDVEEIDTQKIPSRVQRFGTFRWNGNICINATADFLQFLKQTVVGSGVWRIQRRDRGAPTIEIFKVEDSGTGNILKHDFVRWREELQAREIVERLSNNTAPLMSP